MLSRPSRSYTPQKVSRLSCECGVNCGVKQQQAGRIPYFLLVHLLLYARGVRT